MAGLLLTVKVCASLVALSQMFGNELHNEEIIVRN